MKRLTWSFLYRSGHRRAGQQRGRLGGGDHWVFYQRRNHSTWRSVVRYAGESVSNAQWQELPAVHLFYNVNRTAPLSSVHPCLCGRRREELRHWLVDHDHAANLSTRPLSPWVSSSKHTLRINSSDKHRLPHLIFLLNLIYRKIAFNNKENW